MNCRILILTMTALSTVLLVVLRMYYLRKKKQLDATEEATKPSILLSPLPPLPPIVLPSLSSSSPPVPSAEPPVPPPAPASPGMKPKKAPEAPTPSIGDVRDIPMFTPRHALLPG